MKMALIKDESKREKIKKIIANIFLFIAEKLTSKK